MTRFLQVVFAAALLGACAPEGYTPYYATPGVTGGEKEFDQFTLKRTACFGFCPVYDVTVYENDVLIFHGERFVAETGGAVSKRLPDGSFKKLISIARAHNFSDFDARYPNEAGDNCGPIPTDMPSIIISFDSGRLDHEVNLYQGCSFDGRDSFDEMVLQMDAVLNVDDMIGPREAFYGAKE
ncbi:DUF6438 domain-containing protein [Hyphococcus sp.]|uniref:DUF6438 domain-containing protein n=1 Tax=Hyphococcus sp. TaxID=2038636 RepID=UPI003D143591